MQEKTAWVFLLPVNDKNKNPEDRHIYDLSFGVFKLESCGIAKSNIFLAIDGINYDNISSLVEQFTGSPHKIYSTEKISDLKKDSSFCSNLVLFICGHGHEYGLASHRGITPHKLLTTICSCTNFKNIVVYLGPCFSGIFNYLPTSDTQNIVFVGSTKFYSSIATSVTETIANGIKYSWIADIFLMGVFRWFTTPEDIDGDGLFTILDSYKSISLYTNKVYSNIKKKNFPRLIQEIPKQHNELKKLIKQHGACLHRLRLFENVNWKRFAKMSKELMTGIELKMIPLYDNIDRKLEIDLFNIQESWISDSMKALRIEYKNGEIKTI